MTAAKNETVVEIPSTVSAIGSIIVRGPTFAELQQATDRYTPGRVTIFCLGVEVSEGDVKSVTYFERELDRIRDVVYDLERKELRFTGHWSHSYERTSYNQSSTSTEHVYCQVVLSETTGRSQMYEIDNPHPSYRTW